MIARLAAPLALTLLLAAALAGCASYVNIPPDSSEDIAINAINAPPTPGLLHAALDYALIERPAPQTPYAVRLPVEASDSTWDKVLADRSGAVRFSQAPQGAPVYDVRSIRIRGADAWVDIVVPPMPDNRPLLEVRLQGHLTGWRVTSVRHWSAGVIRERETSGQYGGEPSDASTLRPVTPGDESPAAESTDAPAQEPAEQVDEPKPATLTPIRPVKPGDGG